MILNGFLASVSNGGAKGANVPTTAVKTENAAGSSCQIMELCGNTSMSLKRPRSTKSYDDSVVDIMNPPYKAWMYRDHDLNYDFVCVAVTIFYGSKEATFDLTEDGLKVIVKFSWPKALHNPAEMFNDAIKSKTLSKHHPMLHAMASSDLDSDITPNSTPEGQWVIPLPCKVRREVSSYSMEKIKSETARFMFLKFTAYQKDVIIEQANRTLSFDD